MALLDIVKQSLTWWNGQTLGTRLLTWRRGEEVGRDEQGNVYYQMDGGRRRWVIYRGESDASRVPPEWHGWLHHMWHEPPSKVPVPNQPWEKPHRPNLTGTVEAYAPAGSIRRATPEPRSDYEAWTPD